MSNLCTFVSVFHRVFDVNEKNKVDINELLKIKPENDTLKKMQHSKWATSNNLFDYNSFINDFYALIEEFNSYKDRTEPDKQSESQEVKLLDFFKLHNKTLFTLRILSKVLSLSLCLLYIFCFCPIPFQPTQENLNTISGEKIVQDILQNLINRICSSVQVLE